MVWHTLAPGSKCPDELWGRRKCPRVSLPVNNVLLQQCKSQAGPWHKLISSFLHQLQTTVQTIHQGIKHSQTCLCGRILYLLCADGTECPFSSLGYLLAKPIFLLLSCNSLISMPVYVMCVNVLQARTTIWSQTWHCLCLMMSHTATHPTLSAEFWLKSLLPFWLCGAFGCQKQRQPSSETRATAVNLKQIFFILNATAGHLNRKE